MIDDAVFAVEFEAARGTLYAISMRILKSPEDSEENVQDCFISAWKARDKFSGDSKLSTWLGRIAINEALMKLRRSKSRVASLHLSIDTPIAEGLTLGDSIEHEAPSQYRLEESSRILSKVVERVRVSQNARTAFLQHYHGFELLEIGRMCNANTNTVKARSYRGCRELREVLKTPRRRIAV